MQKSKSKKGLVVSQMGQLTQLVEHVVYLLGSIGRRGGYLTGVDDYLLGIQMNAAQNTIISSLFVFVKCFFA